MWIWWKSRACRLWWHIWRYEKFVYSLARPARRISGCCWITGKLLTSSQCLGIWGLCDYSAFNTLTSIMFKPLFFLSEFYIDSWEKDISYPTSNIERKSALVWFEPRTYSIQCRCIIIRNNPKPQPQHPETLNPATGNPISNTINTPKLLGTERK